MAEEPISALFRPSKRRQTLRKRADEDEDDVPTTESEGAHSISKDDLLYTATGDERAADTTQSRRPGKSRKIGVNFSSASSTRPMDQTDHSAIAKLESAQDTIPAAVGRFTAPTGQAVQKEDKHMWVPPSFYQGQDTVTDGPGWHI